MSTSALPCVLVVADPSRVDELQTALAEPLPQGAIELVVSTGGDDTIELFAAHRPEVVVLTASLEVGDATALVEVLRAMASRAEVAVVVVGDDTGPIRTVIDAGDLHPDKFVTRPLSGKALRFAVGACLDAVALVRRGVSRTGTKPRIKINGTTDPHADGTDSSSDIVSEMVEVDEDPTAATLGTRAALRARWEALADSIGGDTPEDDVDEPAPLPPPTIIHPRRKTSGGMPAVELESEPDSESIAPTREPTLILREDPAAATPGTVTADPPQMLERKGEDQWSEPLPLAELVDRDSRSDPDPVDDVDFDDVSVHEAVTPPPPVMRDDNLVPLGDTPPPVEAEATTPVRDEPSGGRDFARQLRAKMSMMAQRLFQAESAPAVDVGPKHDHHTEIDLASLGEEQALGGGGTEFEGRARSQPEVRDLATSPGSWDTQVRERGLPDSGEIVRGVSDAAMLLAKMFAQSATGRVGFRKADVEKIVFLDQGRPVFAASNEPDDRMGQLLVREGKITAAQYERCQSHVAASGRRMGEILVDFGYLKRRELLPAVRRHVEDVLYSLFGWDRGHYHITLDTMPSAERIRLSRHPASLILEGIRRKLDRSSLEKLVGPPSTVIEVRDRERLGSVVQSGDLGQEERAALAAFDGQADLAQVARTVGVDVADVLPLAWGLCVLGLATARRSDAEQVDDASALVGETDLAIDRDRVRARWQLVTEADYFALLGVRRDATAFEIRRAYQSARRDFAADCFPADLRRELARELEDIASVLDEAFRVLRDDWLRLTYLTNLVE